DQAGEHGPDEGEQEQDGVTGRADIEHGDRLRVKKLPRSGLPRFLPCSIVPTLRGRSQSPLGLRSRGRFSYGGRPPPRRAAGKVRRGAPGEVCGGAWGGGGSPGR